MCNEVARRIALGQLRDDWAELKIPLVFPEGFPNLASVDSIRITDSTLVIRAAAAETDAAGAGQGEGAEGVVRRWSWPGAGGRPVYNYRSDGRDLRKGRCLIPVDGFYEFTAPQDPKAKRKDKWLFAHARDDWFCLAGLWRADPTVGEAFTLLTTEPGPDVAPYHARQVVVLDRADYAGWLDGSVPSADLCRPAPAGTLRVERVR
jgi:putative SOS response-associated peptidase YedK